MNKSSRFILEYGEIEKARVSFNLTARLLGDQPDQLQLVKEDLQVAEETAKEYRNTKSKPTPPQIEKSTNPAIRNASNVLDLTKADASKGNFIITKEEVKSGETILVEEPFAACLLPKFAGSHCHECFARLVAPIGCSNCSGVAFCSISCKEKACGSYHQYECRYLDLLVGSGMSILCHTTLRIITQTNNDPKKLQEVREFLDGLCKHSEQRKPFDYLQRTLMTTFLLRFLQHSEFFGRRKTEAVDPTEQELSVGVLILGLLQALQFNAHEIFETRLGDRHRITGSLPINIGVGVYKTGSLFNHDCSPCVARYFYGKTLVFTTTRPLGVGEMASENYGPICTRKTAIERQRALQARYWFKCECRACNENWPILDKMNYSASLRCPNPECTNILYQTSNTTTDTKCNKCKQKVNLRNSLLTVKRSTELYKKGAELMDVSFSFILLLFSINQPLIIYFTYRLKKHVKLLNYSQKE